MIKKLLKNSCHGISLWEKLFLPWQKLFTDCTHQHFTTNAKKKRGGGEEEPQESSDVTSL